MKVKFPQKVCSRIPWVLVKQTGRALAVTRLKCKMWNCEVCGPKRQKMLQHQAKKGRPTKFLTLTASPQSGDTPTQQAQALRSAWRTIRRRARKEFSLAKIEFLAVFERTEAEAPHLHILLRSKYIPQKWLSQQMAALSSSPIVDIRAIKNKRQASNYVTKYISKAPERFEGCKRYWRSLDYLQPTAKETHDASGLPILWYIVRARIEKVSAFLSKHGFNLKETEISTHLHWNSTIPPPIRPGHIHELRWCEEARNYAL